MGATRRCAGVGSHRGEGVALRQEVRHSQRRHKAVLATLEDALGALPESDRAGGVKALAAAAVLGSPFDDHEWTLACEKLNFGHKESLLQSLMERQIIRPAHERLGFVHGLLREAAGARSAASSTPPKRPAALAQ